MEDRRFFLNERHCAQCGKEFYTRPGYVFKKTDGNTERYFCRYTCMLRWQEAKAAKRQYKKKGAVYGELF